MSPRLGKLAPIAQAKRLDAFLLTSPISMMYFCGHFYNFEIGPSPFHLIPAALFAIPDGDAALIIADNETSPVNDSDSGFSVCPYGSYVYTESLDFTRRFLLPVFEFANRHRLYHARIGVEADSLPFSVARSLTDKYPQIQWVDITTELARLRMIKDRDELLSIRATTHLCDVGQEAVLKYARPGMTEIELFTLVRGEMDTAAEQRVPMMADLVSGSRSFEAGGNPSSREIAKGDLVLSDITPCLNGYWGDTCNTMVVGEPSPAQVANFKLIEEALEIAMDAVKPGVRACDIDSILRKHISAVSQYDHHSGHGVGLAYHEEPRITPYNQLELLPGMVIAIEPGIYIDGYGIRLEHLVEVTASGCKKISNFKHRLM